MRNKSALPAKGNNTLLGKRVEPHRAWIIVIAFKIYKMGDKISRAVNWAKVAKWGYITKLKGV
jgi:hypothetical protein